MLRAGTIGWLLLFAYVSHLPAAEIKPVRDWSGSLADDKDLPLQSAAPKNGVVTDDKAWSKLWLSWKKDPKPPKVDFEKEILLVTTTSCAANKIGGTFDLDDGNLKAMYLSTLIGGPGFAWRVFVIPRKGIEKVNGEPLK